VTIDENEVAHLGVLLEQVFPEYMRHMVTIVINPKGTAKANFARVEEYAYYVVPNIGREVIAHLPPPKDEPEAIFDTIEYTDEDDLEPDSIEAEEPEDVEEIPEDEVTNAVAATSDYSVLYLRRRGAQSSARTDRPRQFYAIFVNEKTKTVAGLGPNMAVDKSYKVTRKKGVLSVYPIDVDGNERTWRYGRDTMQKLIDAGEIRVGRYIKARDTWVLNHWKPREGPRTQRVRTVWWRPAHDAGTHGSTLLANLLGRRNAFPFPKSLYAVRDCLDAAVRDRPNALIVDFFAGSGTTLHATALLNQQDGGNRRCVLVTNNEVDQGLTRELNEQGVYRGDPEFEKHGIFWSATKPRISAALSGIREDGSPIPKGARYRYLEGREFADGFEENCAFFTLRYLDPLRIELGRSFDAIHPTLWMKTGSRGPMPTDVDPYAKWAVREGNGYAILFDEDALRDFQEELYGANGIEHVFLVTDSTESYAEMRQHLGERYRTSMLYRDYLRNVRIDPQRLA
jgi:adenine-specific DNA-methyltransferase